MLNGKFYITIFVLMAVIFSSFLIYPKEAQALGVSPPLIKNEHLLKGSHFEQTVYINQGAPKENLLAKAEINLNRPKYKDWVKIKPGLEFVIPQVRLFPLTVVVDVPNDAEAGERVAGEIKITTFPETKGRGQGQVAVGIGLAIALDFTVSEEIITDYEVPLWRIVPMENGWPLKIGFTIDNKGNNKVRPQKIVVNLESRGVPPMGPFEAANLAYVDAFSRGEIIAELPVKLAEGGYFIQIQFYKSENEVLEYKSAFDVLPKGSLPKPPKPWWFYALIGSGGASAVALVASTIKFRKKIFNILIAIPLFFIKTRSKFGKIMRVIKEKEQ